MTPDDRRASRRRFHQSAFALLATASAAVPWAQPRPRVVASFSILADIVREVSPPELDVSALVGPDSDAHVFEPTPADGRRLAQADLVVVNGLGFEGWIERLVRVSGYRGTVVVATRGLAARQGGHHGKDPHAWQDLALGRRYAQTVAQALAARWPQHQPQVEQRLSDYQRRIDDLHARVLGWMAAIPRSQRRVITSHDAFGYFAAAYGVDFLAPRSWTTRSEPSAAAVARLVRQVREQKVRALFLENISDPRLIERIAAESGARVGGTLYSDALSGVGGPAPTYLAMFEHNARTLAAAMSG